MYNPKKLLLSVFSLTNVSLAGIFLGLIPRIPSKTPQNSVVYYSEFLSSAVW